MRLLLPLVAGTELAIYTPALNLASFLTDEIPRQHGMQEVPSWYHLAPHTVW